MIGLLCYVLNFKRQPASVKGCHNPELSEHKFSWPSMKCSDKAKIHPIFLLTLRRPNSFHHLPSTIRRPLPSEIVRFVFIRIPHWPRWMWKFYRKCSEYSVTINTPAGIATSQPTQTENFNSKLSWTPSWMWVELMHHLLRLQASQHTTLPITRY